MISRKQKQVYRLAQKQATASKYLTLPTHVIEGKLVGMSEKTMSSFNSPKLRMIETNKRGQTAASENYCSKAAHIV